MGNYSSLIMFHAKSVMKTNPGAMHRTNQNGSVLMGKGVNLLNRKQVQRQTGTVLSASDLKAVIEWTRKLF